MVDVRRRVDWPSVWQLVLCSVTGLGLLGAAVIFALVGLGQLISPELGGTELASQALLTAAGLSLGGLLMLPSIWYAWRRLNGYAIPALVRQGKAIHWLLPTLLLAAIYALVLWLGNAAASQATLSWLLLPILNILAVGLPILWLTWLALRGLAAGSAQRGWGIFDSGMVLGPLIILIVEIVLMGVIGMLWLIAISRQPALMEEMIDLFERLRYTPPVEDIYLRMLGPYLTRPAVLFTLFAYVAVLVPLIEEALKPIGLWLLAGRSMTTAQGFAGGALSGAGFALFETLGNASMAGEDWTTLVVSRIGTAVIHITTTGLMGIALAKAFRGRSWLGLGLTYLGMVSVHGLWNGLAILGIGALDVPDFLALPPLIERFSSLAIPGLGILLGGSFVTLLVANRKLRQPSALDIPANLEFAEEETVDGNNLTDH